MNVLLWHLIATSEITLNFPKVHAERAGRPAELDTWQTDMRGANTFPKTDLDLNNLQGLLMWFQARRTK